MFTNSMYKFFLISVIVLVCAMVILGLFQLWTMSIDWEIFIKTMITLGVLTLLSALLIAIKADLGAHKKMKDENYLD